MQKAIDSALSQTYKNIEVIVINDGSNDGGKTDEIALSYGTQIKYYKKENGGVSTALNLGIKRMTGEYFSWLSHDDKYSPNKIEYQVRAIADYQDQNIVCLCASQEINKNDEIISCKNEKYLHEGINDWEEVLMTLLTHGAFNGCALMIPKAIFDVCGNFDEDLRYNQDSLMWMEICLKRFKFLYINDVLVYQRIHDGQLTQTGRKLFHHDCMIRNKKLLPKLLEVSDRNHNFLYMYAKGMAKHNNPAIVEECISEGKNVGLVKWEEVVQLKFLDAYGRIRPIIRKLYYRIFEKVKTE